MKNQDNHTNQKNQDLSRPSGSSDNLKPFYNTTIPSDWVVLEFGEFTELEKGKYVPIENEYKQCLELEHFDQGTGSINGWVNSSEQKSTKNKFQKGQVLFGKLRPYLQKYWLAEFDGVCSSEVWVLKSKDKKCSNEFLFRLIQSNKFIQVANVSSGSKMPRADWDYVSEFPFALPPLPEQRAIAQVLGLMDSAINQNNQLIAQKELRKKWLMQNLLTGKKRLKGFEGKWKNKTLKNILTLAGKPFIPEKEELYTQIGIRSHTKGIFYKEKVTGKELGDKRVFWIDPDCFVVNIVFAWEHAIAKTTENEIGMIASHRFPMYKTKEGILDLDYLLYYFKSPMGKYLLGLASPGGAGRNKTLGKSEFIRLQIPVPNIEEQTAIAQVLQSADKEIQLLKTKTEKLREQKMGMMQVLLTGKKRLKIETE